MDGSRGGRGWRRAPVAHDPFGIEQREDEARPRPSLGMRANDAAAAGWTEGAGRVHGLGGWLGNWRQGIGGARKWRRDKEEACGLVRWGSRRIPMLEESGWRRLEGMGGWDRLGLGLDCLNR